MCVHENRLDWIGGLSVIHVGYKLTFQQTDQVTKWIYSSKFTVFSGTACSSELEFLQQIRVCHRERYGEMECDWIPIRVGVCVCTLYSVHQTQFKNEVKYPFFIVSAYVFPYIIVPPFDFLYFVGMNHCLSLHMIQTFICYSIQVLKARRNFAPYQTAHCQDMANWEGEKKQSTEK